MASNNPITVTVNVPFAFNGSARQLTTPDGTSVGAFCSQWNIVAPAGQTFTVNGVPASPETALANNSFLGSMISGQKNGN